MLLLLRQYLSTTLTTITTRKTINNNHSHIFVSWLNNIVKRSYIKRPNFPPLNESELEENCINGTGPGGQKVNKSRNCCQLKHIPTGITSVSHHTRSLAENRKIAREILQEKLDFYYNNENSYLYKLKKEKQIEKLEKNKKAKKNLEKKLEFKKREGLLDNTNQSRSSSSTDNTKQKLNE